MSKTAQLGWIGTGNMGYPMAERLLKAGHSVAVYNRTRAKAEPLEQYGAMIVDHPSDLGTCDVVFTMVADPTTLLAVTVGEHGVLTAADSPRVLIDASTVDAGTSNRVRAAAAERGGAFLAAPVSGNGKVVKAGRLSVAASGPRATFEEVKHYLEALGEGVTYVGDGEAARIVKIAHNVLLGVVTQCLAEITLLAEKGGIKRSAFLDFINNSVMGSVFTRYKSPAIVNLAFKPTFTPPLLLKDLDLGLAAAKELGVPMPVAATTREIVQTLIGHGYTDVDFATLILLAAKGANMELVAEDVIVDDGLSPRN